MREGEVDVEVDDDDDDELDVDDVDVGTYPGCHCTESPRDNGSLTMLARTGASVKATEVAWVQVQRSGEVSVVGSADCVHADHRFPPLQVASPTHGASICPPERQSLASLRLIKEQNVPASTHHLAVFWGSWDPYIPDRYILTDR